jgi:hypothetical protein
MSSKKKLVLATLIAPLVAPGLYFIGLLLFELSDTSREIEPMLIFDLVVLFAAPVSYAGMLFVGLPYYAILRKYNNDSFYALTTGGLIIGIVIFFLTLKFEGIDVGSIITNAKYYEILILVFIGATLGGSVACCFAKIRS